MIETKVTLRERWAGPQLRVEHSHEPSVHAQLAIRLIETWGLVTAKPEGEDSSGRALRTVMPVEEVVTRACNMAESAFQEFERRGWLVAVPPEEPEQKPELAG